MIWIGVGLLTVILIKLATLSSHLDRKSNYAEELLNLFLKHTSTAYPAFPPEFLINAQRDIEKKWNEFETAFPSSTTGLQSAIERAEKYEEKEKIVKTFSSLISDYEFAEKRR